MTSPSWISLRKCHLWLHDLYHPWFYFLWRILGLNPEEGNENALCRGGEGSLPSHQGVDGADEFADFAVPLDVLY